MSDKKATYVVEDLLTIFRSKFKQIFFMFFEKKINTIELNMRHFGRRLSDTFLVAS